ncbi:DUF192 domain-containing protein [Pararhizobium mangrovi]|uniref:DUF192 domain-containing protein n=1 Tax=Pararhizobium mangrovi TaxID=2590452 RepID=A0A506TXX2_9HYPH|nr:DUF192 domain-containing protein [Pararhizobium mangrovi]TPW25811.1 DUF192 domain-containing protein [Pararhizobium mangrovi]
MHRILPVRTKGLGGRERFVLALATTLALLAFSCSDGSAAQTSPLTITTRTGDHVFHVEEALTKQTRERGLMHRETMADDHGMIFRFDRSRPVTMWMKNTPLSLDMIFVKADGEIAGIARKAQPFSTDIIASPEPVRFVIELKGGVAGSIDAKAGDHVSNRLIDEP